MSHGFSLLIIALGGAFGAVSRYQITLWSHQWWGNLFPYGTLLVNVIGSFFIGLIAAALHQQLLLSPSWKPLINIGFLGALTTFSTFSLETLLLLQQGEWLKAAANVLLNILLCLIAVAVGYTRLT